MQRLKDEKAVLEGSVNYLRARMAVESALASPSSSEETSSESEPAPPSSSEQPPTQQGPD